MRKFISLEFVLDIKNYRQSFQKWMKIRSKLHTTETKQTKCKLFDKYLQVIKPVIHHFTDIVERASTEEYGFYNETLNEEQVKTIKRVFQPLRNFQIVHELPKVLLPLEEVSKTFIKQIQPIFRLDVKAYPNNKQLKWWGRGIEVSPVQIEGCVVAGKGEGRKNLGMPTANLELNTDLQKKLDDYPNGVYLVDFIFANGKKYQGAGCLGTNPHYQNFQERRRIQVYVLHDFGDNLFYGSKVTVVLLKLIRFQGKFPTFDSFLQAMHNDIQIAKEMAHQSTRIST